MFPLLSGLMTGGAGLLGSIFTAQQSAQNTQEQIAGQQAMQQQAEAYNTQMSNTAYQRASADMKAAGLNPMMMFGSGSAASTPTMSAQVMPTPQRTSPMAGLGPAAASVVNSAVSAKTFDRLTEEIANLKAQEAKTGAETVTEQRRPELLDAQTFERWQNAGLLGLQYSGAKFESLSAEDKLAINEQIRRAVNQGAFVGGSVKDAISPFVSSAGAARDLARARRFGFD